MLDPDPSVYTIAGSNATLTKNWIRIIAFKRRIRTRASKNPDQSFKKTGSGSELCINRNRIYPKTQIRIRIRNRAFKNPALLSEISKVRIRIRAFHLTGSATLVSGPLVRLNRFLLQSSFNNLFIIFG